MTRRVLAVFLFLVAGVAAAQTGAISGTVTAEQGGAPLPTAVIRAARAGGAPPVSARSAVNGGYTLASLPPGDYQVTIELFPFFLPFRQESVQVVAGRTTRLDVRISDVTFGTLGDGGADFAELLRPKPAPAGRAPRTREGKPDLSGVWQQALPEVDRDPPQRLPWAEALVKRRLEDQMKDAPSAHCLPMGLSMTGYFAPYKIVQIPSLLVIIDANGDPARQIYLDGRAHPREFLPSFMGHSIARWDGDTLVVDTVGFNDRGWITLNGYPQTEKLRVAERFRRPDLGHLELLITFDDPSAFQNPWSMKRVSSLGPQEAEFGEYVCSENNRDAAHMVGK